MPAIVKINKTNKASAPKAPPSAAAHGNAALTPEEERAITAEARDLEGHILAFPGTAAKRFAWAEKVQHAAERDAAELVRAPFHGEPPLTIDEIRAQRKRIAFLRMAEARMQMVLTQARKTTADLALPVSEAQRHRATLLRFFGLRYRNDLEGQQWIAHVREGNGDADLVQDVTDILERCKLEEAAIADAPRAEATARARLEALLPALKQRLSSRSLSAEGQTARALRDRAYTLVVRSEQRIRAAAEYWYTDTNKAKMKDYALFTPRRSARTGEDGGSAEEPKTDVAAPS